MKLWCPFTLWYKFVTNPSPHYLSFYIEKEINQNDHCDLEKCVKYTFSLLEKKICFCIIYWHKHWSILIDMNNLKIWNVSDNFSLIQFSILWNSITITSLNCQISCLSYNCILQGNSKNYVWRKFPWKHTTNS